MGNEKRPTGPSAPPPAPGPRPAKPPAPEQKFLSAASPISGLYENVRKAVASLSAYFRPEISISGILATDIFALNSSLGTTIEEKTVDALNQVRTLWDPKGEYPHHSFLRQTQTFPDVILQAPKPDGKPEILLGMELKGWYILSKELEPSLRFETNESACAEADLFVVFPWALSSVISGTPKLYKPYVAPCRYIAQMRTYYWQHSETMGKDKNRVIKFAADVGTYPKKSDAISDKAEDDGGRNFGRIARTGAMDAYIREILELPLCGISVEHWCQFLKLFTEKMSHEKLTERVDKYAQKWMERLPVLKPEEVEIVRELLRQIAAILEGKR